MRVLVAGGRGFIGARAVDALAAAGHDAGVLEAGDDAGAIGARGWDALVWSAGGRRATVEENRVEHVTAAVAAIEACRGLARVVYLGSGESYGAQPPPFTEDTPLAGTSPYARAKIEGERAIAEAAAHAGAGATVLRPAVVYGPGQRGPMFVPSLVAALAAGERFAMTAGEQTRDLVHVDDVAAAIAAAVAGPPGVYNVSTGVEHAMRDVAAMVAARVGGDAAARLDVGALPYRDGEQMRYVLDPSRAAAALGWRARVSLAAGLDALVARALSSR